MHTSTFSLLCARGRLARASGVAGGPARGPGPAGLPCFSFAPAPAGVAQPLDPGGDARGGRGLARAAVVVAAAAIAHVTFSSSAQFGLDDGPRRGSRSEERRVGK